MNIQGMIETVIGKGQTWDEAMVQAVTDGDMVLVATLQKIAPRLKRVTDTAGKISAKAVYYVAASDIANAEIILAETQAGRMTQFAIRQQAQRKINAVVRFAAEVVKL